MAGRVTSPGTRSPGEIVVCADVGSTFTKAAAIGPGGRVLALAQRPTTSGTDVLEGLDAAVAALGAGRVADSSIVACSSAGGGLRLAVVGHERVISAEAGRRVALSAGARVVSVTAGFLDAAGVDALASAAPDVLLVVGGTDGGDAEVLLHNCRVLGRSPLGCPIVLAGNSDAAAQGAALLGGRGRMVLTTANVIPRIGALDPGPARRAIREVFITHVIGGKGLSPGPRFGDLVAGATPDAVLAGIEVVAEVRAQAPDALGDVMALDIGGATTDVYSVLTPDEDAPHDAVETLWHGRTVEGDLGMRWSAPDVVAAARAERLVGGGAGGSAGGGGVGGAAAGGGGGAPAGGGAPGPGAGVGGAADAFDALAAAAERRRDQVAFLPRDAQDVSDDLLLARLAAMVAARRHGRPGPQGSRDLTHVALLIGSGGVLRHAEHAQAMGVLEAVLTDVAGGWRLPRQARVILDRQYLLAPIGLLELSGRPVMARALARTLLEQ